LVWFPFHVEQTQGQPTDKKELSPNTAIQVFKKREFSRV